MPKQIGFTSQELGKSFLPLHYRQAVSAAGIAAVAFLVPKGNRYVLRAWGAFQTNDEAAEAMVYITPKGTIDEITIDVFPVAHTDGAGAVLCQYAGRVLPAPMVVEQEDVIWVTCPHLTGVHTMMGFISFEILPALEG